MITDPIDKDHKQTLDIYNNQWANDSLKIKYIHIKMN